MLIDAAAAASFHKNSISLTLWGCIMSGVRFLYLFSGNMFRFLCWYLLLVRRILPKASSFWLSWSNHYVFYLLVFFSVLILLLKIFEKCTTFDYGSNLYTQEQQLQIKELYWLKLNFAAIPAVEKKSNKSFTWVFLNNFAFFFFWRSFSKYHRKLFFNLKKSKKYLKTDNFIKKIVQSFFLIFPSVAKSIVRISKLHKNEL